MVEDEEIGRFDPDRQSEIRAAIARLVQVGHERRFLMLGRDGAVMIDRDAIPWTPIQPVTATTIDARFIDRYSPSMRQ